MEGWRGQGCIEHSECDDRISGRGVIPVVMTEGTLPGRDRSGLQKEVETFLRTLWRGDVIPATQAAVVPKERRLSSGEPRRQLFRLSLMLYGGDGAFCDAAAPELTGFSPRFRWDLSPDLPLWPHSGHQPREWSKPLLIWLPIPISSIKIISHLHAQRPNTPREVCLEAGLL